MQFIALPIVARKLGPEMFGVFAAMSTIPAFFSSADLGIGPALGHKLALGVVGDDRPLQGTLF